MNSDTSEHAAKDSFFGYFCKIAFHALSVEMRFYNDYDSTRPVLFCEDEGHCYGGRVGPGRTQHPHWLAANEAPDVMGRIH